MTRSHSGACSLKLKWTSRALSQFSDALHYIAKDNPAAAHAVAERIAAAASLLLEQPRAGDDQVIIEHQSSGGITTLRAYKQYLRDFCVIE